ncbi:MAG: prepilin-type N-terminal cleavage/methylation domain-containing protein [Opitutaceae bacterium]|nr:prepilin-type N-terminal cleavage/methylation domain-containing protein [Opitutaceae bacterium]
MCYPSACPPASPDHPGIDFTRSAIEDETPLRRLRSSRAVTLVEVMVALTLMATVMLGFISAFMQSRRVTESNVLHAAATSLVYGIIEQMKGLDYTTLLPSGEVDDAAPASLTPPYVRVRINPDLTVWLRPVYTPAPTDGSTPAPAAPNTTPAPNATAASVGAIDNFIGSLPLSTVTGTRAQQLSLNIWLWIDEIPDSARDVSEVKKITLVYTYSYNDGAATHTVRDREVFIRTRYDQ